MGIQSAMYSGVSGLNTNSQAMSVIGNNLANTNTIGFKGARTIFSDLLSSSIYGSGGFSQVGRGVNISVVDNIYSQGTFESTNSATDVAIEGEGFFLLKEPGNDSTFYSRAGAFRFDEEGYLVNPEGLHVQGKRFDQNGELVAGDPGDIQVRAAGLVPAQASTALSFNTNLDANSQIPDGGWPAWDPADTMTYNYSASTQVYDSLGEPHLLTAYWRITDPAANTWEWYWTAEDINGAAVGQETGQNAAGEITFNADGTLNTGGVANIGPIDWGNGSNESQLEITFDTTQFDTDSEVISQDQNGYAAGNLTNVAINSEGIAIATYSNGEQVKIGQLVLGKFTNPNGLEAAGANLYVATNNSGTPRVGLPGPELGNIYTNSLEQSNVDLGQEFVKMITVQRGFQANSKIISTVDELLGELINLKR